MRISRIKIENFRRFTDLEIRDISETVRLVVLAGPNGSGKSSLFDALALAYQIGTGFGWKNDDKYYAKTKGWNGDPFGHVQIDAFEDKDIKKRGAFYFRTAYRNDPEFSHRSLSRQGPVVDDIRVQRMIEGDTAVSKNYQRLASQAFEDVFAKEPPATTVGEFRERVVGEIRDSIKRLFPDLILNTLGNPIEEGTFRFDKGATKGFQYKNLSGGEKAAFDLVLDVIVNRSSFADSVYCIDEPDAHMNTRLQGMLLAELYRLVPQPSQLWVATHSIGMMHWARDLEREHPGSVAFLDFQDHNFDTKVVISPSRPVRSFWKKVLRVALDDLSSLVVPEQVVVCEGNPTGVVSGKNSEHDATIYNAIFEEEFPSVTFLAGGNSKDITSDRLGFVAALPKLATGIKVRRLIDRDDHAPTDITAFVVQGISTLRRRHLEAYTYDDEVLAALCASVGRPGDTPDLLSDKQAAIAASVKRGNPADDIKSAAGEIYNAAKRRLALTGVGNDQMAFARNTLAPLIKPGLTVYAELKSEIFSS